MKEKVCKKIIALRKRHNYSQEEVSVLLNMGQNTYSRLESGKTKLDLERLCQLAQLYRIPLYDLLADVLLLPLSKAK